MPIIKLCGVAMRSLSKPIATYIKNHLKDSPAFAKSMTNIGNKYQRSVNWLTFSDGNHKFKELNQNKAIEIGSEIAVELILFGIMASFVLYDHLKSKENAKLLKQRLDNLERTILLNKDGNNDEIKKIKEDMKNVGNLIGDNIEFTWHLRDRVINLEKELKFVYS